MSNHHRFRTSPVSSWKTNSSSWVRWNVEDRDRLAYLPRRGTWYENSSDRPGISRICRRVRLSKRFLFLSFCLPLPHPTFYSNFVHLPCVTDYEDTLSQALVKLLEAPSRDPRVDRRRYSVLDLSCGSYSREKLLNTGFSEEEISSYHDVPRDSWTKYYCLVCIHEDCSHPLRRSGDACYLFHSVARKSFVPFPLPLLYSFLKKSLARKCPLVFVKRNRDFILNLWYSEFRGFYVTQSHDKFIIRSCS